MEEAEVLRRLQGAGGAPRLLASSGAAARSQAMLTTFCGAHTFEDLVGVARNDQEMLHALLLLCRALQQLHRRGYVHNDLKDNNVVVRREQSDGRLHVSIIDLGLARRKGVPLFATRRDQARSWMAPELFECEPCRASMDVFSLGASCGVLGCARDNYPLLNCMAERPWPGGPPPPARHKAIKRAPQVLPAPPISPHRPSTPHSTPGCDPSSGNSPTKTELPC
ncbi:Eukaryotic translation initiation factor 2-alpha kinase pek-1 [Chionoecetes opilio]|uniref:Eukaryotic translation initiation factor 2-alpha kinase pek-1 n=1 Tax=Chionoecetes opilio TaxID=41210 RepID=A0A8J5D1F5_CHIOP|nr:Eukaryotic translation initiation factor 2-alpha kinase pek-1 [Chionoecetes opilio]